MKLGNNGIRYIGMFESVTGAKVEDCVIDNDVGKVTIVVKKGDMGLAIGKGGFNINKVKKMIKRDIEIVENSTDIRKFIENLLHPACVKNVEVLSKNNKSCVYVEVLTKDKGIAIGKSGKNIKKVKLLMKRNQNIDDVIIR